MKKNKIWGRLKDYKCPLCNSNLKRKESIEGEKSKVWHTCTECTFDISNTKLNRIVKEKSERQRSHVEQEEDNQNALNNF